METHNYKFSLALIPFLVLLFSMLQYSCMVYGYWTPVPPSNWYGPPWLWTPPPYTGQDPPPPPYMGPLDPSPPPPDMGYGSSPPPDMGYGSSPPPDAGQNPSPTPPTSIDHNSQQDYLDAHNKARAEVGVDNMTWSDTVAAYAQQYANSRIGDCRLQHSKDDKYGECIAESSDPQFSGVQAVNMWVEEKKYYHHDSNKCDDEEECGHYTQVVWRDTKQIGCARVKCANSRGVFITCNYDPPGNYEGESPY